LVPFAAGQLQPGRAHLSDFFSAMTASSPFQYHVAAAEVSGLLIIGSTHREASDTNQGQRSKQDQFGRVVHQAVKNIRINWTP
jgi:hypothetical protein